MKYSVVQMNSGQWAAGRGKSCFVNTITDTKEKAQEYALIKSGLWYQAQLDKCQSQLEALGVVDESDPHGWRC